MQCGKSCGKEYPVGPWRCHTQSWGTKPSLPLSLGVQEAAFHLFLFVYFLPPTVIASCWEQGVCGSASCQVPEGACSGPWHSCPGSTAAPVTAGIQDRGPTGASFERKCKIFHCHRFPDFNWLLALGSEFLFKYKCFGKRLSSLPDTQLPFLLTRKGMLQL